MRVAVDGMGGDHAPLEIVKGVLLALEKSPDLEILLVGVEHDLRAVLTKLDASEDRITVLHASQTVAMGEPPVEALRRKPDTSIQRCVEALRARKVEALVCAGDTGGVVAAATLFGRRLKGVKRHGIAIVVPTVKGRALLIDVGANIGCKPIHLLHYAIMGSAYAQDVMHVEVPRVGLLSIGEEAAKGNELVKSSRHLFSRAGLDFVGNVEGRSIFSGVADVVVCDGFVGNVILKVAEGMAETFFSLVLRHAPTGDDMAPETRKILSGLRNALDYSATGGAPLLGADGCIIICHGRSESTAIANAIQRATDFARGHVNERIVEGVARVSMLARMAGFFRSDHE